MEGVLWQCTSGAHFDRLAAYETGAYTWEECAAVLKHDSRENEIEAGEGEEEEEEEEIIEGVRLFVWAGEEKSTELEEGGFDLERWRRYFRGSVVRMRE